MDTNMQVHNLIILDESGSMESIKSTVIQGFNEMVQTIQGSEKQFPEQKHFISFLTFNGLGMKWLHFSDPVKDLKAIDGSSFRPEASTPLLDAMGLGINKLKQALEGQSDCHVLVTILTDGEENASKEFSKNGIKAMVEGLKQNRWTFTYIGACHDVEKAAFSLSINNTLEFSRDPADTMRMFASERTSRGIFYKKVYEQQDVSTDYFERLKEEF